MDKLRIPLSMLPDKGLPIDVLASEEELRPEGAKDISVDPVLVHGHLSEAGGDYMFRGQVSGRFRRHCDRCLAATLVPFEVEVTWVFTHHGVERPLEELSDESEDLDEVDDSTLTLQIHADVVDLGAPAWEEVVLAIPAKILCDVNCAGLCPRCGADLNREGCACRDEDQGEPANNGLAGLADMFPDLKTKKLEE